MARIGSRPCDLSYKLSLMPLGIATARSLPLSLPPSCSGSEVSFLILRVSLGATRRSNFTLRLGTPLSTYTKVDEKLGVFAQGGGPRQFNPLF